MASGANVVLDDVPSLDLMTRHGGLHRSLACRLSLPSVRLESVAGSALELWIPLEGTPIRTPYSGGAWGLPRRFGFLPSNFIQAPLFALLEYSGILRIKIIGVGDEDGFGVGTSQAQSLEEDAIPSGSGLQGELHGGSSQWRGRDGESDIGVVEVSSSSSALPISIPSGVGPSSDGEVSAAGGNNRDSSYQRYEIQEVARWIEQVLPFSLLLLVVFIRQHLQGFFVTIWMAAVMFKSNDILRKQTALKGLEIV
ncbi:uncharacterized protein LOC141818667 [Curcuma longa]|uniref:uncharacterized protein LOC141818667 n=1 Tax=Curcuma longa TaxID=136217 RepID=UPI003D9F49EA